MKSTAILSLLICCIGLVSVPTACLSKRNTAPGTDQATIRYGKNGIPNFIKGDNLSASLDADNVFQDLRAANRHADIALYYLDWQRRLFKLTSAREEFIVSDVKSDTMGQTHIRLEQVYHNIPVWSKDMRIHLNADNQVYYVHGSYQPISADVSTTAVISTKTAGDIAIRKKPNPSQWRVEDIAVHIWAPANDVQRLSFRIKLLQGGIYRESCFVDAHNGHILHTISESPEDMKIVLPKKE